MSEIQTRINRPEKNKTVKNYAQQLKSAVISTERKKAILKEMRLELTQQPHRKAKSSAIQLKLQLVTQIQTGQIVTAPIISNSVDRSFIKTQRSTDFIKTASITYSDNVKAAMAVSSQLIAMQKVCVDNDRRKNSVKRLQCKRLKNKQYSVVNSSVKIEAAVGIKSADTSVKKQTATQSLNPDYKGKQRYRLKNKKYTIAKADSENSFAIESMQTVEAAGATVQQTGGMLKTAVKGTSKGVGTIHSMVKSGVKIGLAKEAGRIATAVGGSIKNIAKDTGHQLLKTKIDKSTVADTGTETIKQGLTELRYVDNARKAVLNTARTTTKAGYAIRNIPKSIKAQVQRIKKNAQRAKKAAEKTAAVIKRIVTSKAGIAAIAALAAVLTVVFLINGLVSIVSSAVVSLFAWLCPDGDTTDEAIKNNVRTYLSQIQEYKTDIQAEIDKITGLEPEYRYDGSQIEGLDNFNNRNLQFNNEEALAVLAAQKYRKVLEGGTEDFSFTDEEIKNAVDMFYSFSYRYEYGYCPNWDCSINENVQLSMAEGDFGVTSVTIVPETGLYRLMLQGPAYNHVSEIYVNLNIYTTDGAVIIGSGGADAYNGTWQTGFLLTAENYSKIDWNRVYLTMTIHYCDNPNHCYLYGEVINLDLETVMHRCCFSEDESKIFEVYLEQIRAVSD